MGKQNPATKPLGKNVLFPLNLESVFPSVFVSMVDLVRLDTQLVKVAEKRTLKLYSVEDLKKMLIIELHRCTPFRKAGTPRAWVLARLCNEIGTRSAKSLKISVQRIAASRGGRGKWEYLDRMQKLKSHGN